MRKRIKINLRIISLFLVLTTLFTSTPMSIYAVESRSEEVENDSTNVAEDCSEIALLHDGAEKSSISLKKDGEEVLTAFTNGIQPTGYSW